MKKVILVIIIFIIFKNLFAQGNLIHIPDDYLTIQSGIEAADDGDTVLVTPGTYKENINFKGKNIVVSSHYCLNHDSEIITSTIIDGSNPSHPDTASVVLFIYGEDSTAVLQGFTITGGRGTKWPDAHIGGFYREGGGILIEAASPVIKNNLIINNEAINKTGVKSAGGGAIRCDGGKPKILNNIIMSNTGLYGAGIVLNYTGAIIKNNIICQNTGGQDYGGSGIWMYKDGPAPKIIENNTIVDNTSTGSGLFGGKGGGIFVWSTSATIRNNIIWGNIQSQGAQIAQMSGGIADCTYSDVEGSWPGEGNIDQNPAFAHTNYYLRDNSPCIDAGVPDSVYNDPEDPLNPGFAKFPSEGSTVNDMGAYGGPGTLLLNYMTTSIDEKNSLQIVPHGYCLKQNYPNPFNPSTIISYSIPISELVNLRVYDILGREILTLVNEVQVAGTYSLGFNGSNLPSGIYLYKLQVGNDFEE
ncbi:MAG: T9SS type A sorting domain-containing protein, partial [bacterium]